MEVKFVIPVIDTESGKYEFNGELSTEAYDSMVYDKFTRTNSQMNAYVNNFGAYGSGLGNNYSYNNNNSSVTDVEDKFTFYPSDAIIKNGNGSDLDVQDLETYCSNNKKFLLMVNINPETIDGDAESEIRYWMEDSELVLEDDTLDQKTQLLSLPKKDFIIDNAVDDNSDEPLYKLFGCKIIKLMRNEYNPFHFIMMVEKIDIE